MRDIDVPELAHRLRSTRPPLVVDVRDTVEFAAGHVPGSRNVPLPQFVDHVPDLTGAPGGLVLVCDGGSRSARVAAWLEQQGVDALVLRGGVPRWAASGAGLRQLVA